MVDISVILIGYNDADRLKVALKSIQDQSHANIEIIAVDDHSSDNSLEILQSAALSDPRIRVDQLPTNSGGCSAPRNRGLELAQGEYVMFCDSDDTLDRHACRNLLRAARAMNADLVVGTAKRHIADGDKVENKLWWPELHAGSRVVTALLQCPDLLYDTITANKIFRREFLREHHIDFPPGLLFEDQLFTLKAYRAAGAIGVIPEVVYHWNVARQHSSRSITQSRKELRNLQDRIAVNKLIDAELTQDPKLALNKHIKFLRHEASLYLATIFEADSDTGAELAGELAKYCSTIPVAAYSEIRSGLRVALYYLLAGHFDNLVESLWWEKGGGVVTESLRPSNPQSLPSQLGQPATWWLDTDDLHLDLIPPSRRVLLHRWTHPNRIVTSDLSGLINQTCTGQMLFVEKRNGATATIPLKRVGTGDHDIEWTLALDSFDLIQDRGINPGESGSIVIELNCDGVLNRSPLIAREADVDVSTLGIELGSRASAGCADQLTLRSDDRGRINWKARGSAKGLMPALNKVRRKLHSGITHHRLPFERVVGRPIVVYAPAELPDYPTRLTRFDTQEWVNELGTDVYLLIPVEPFTPTPARASYAYRTYAQNRLSEALQLADFVITDSPELLQDQRAIPFRRDLGAARYLLPPIEVQVLNTESELIARVRELLAEQSVGLTHG